MTQMPIYKVKYGTSCAANMNAVIAAKNEMRIPGMLEKSIMQDDSVHPAFSSNVKIKIESSSLTNYLSNKEGFIFREK